MSRNVARRKAKLGELVDDLAVGAALRLRADDREVRRVVEAVVACLVEEYPGQDLYIPVVDKPLKYPVERIRAAVAAGESMRSICKRFRLDRRTVYRILSAAEEQPGDSPRKCG